MNKLVRAAIPLFLLSACSEAATAGKEPMPSATAVSPGSIQIKGPVTLSRNDLYPLTHKKQYLSVVQTKGTYAEDWSPSPFMGRSWTGEFQIQLSEESGKVTSAVDLDGYNDDLIFNSFFNLEFEDYNGDGNWDFTIGQYASSNGNVFKLYTLDQTGQIEELPIQGYCELFVSGTDRYSAKLTRTASGFAVSYYDNSIGKDVERSFIWNGQEFVQN